MGEVGEWMKFEGPGEVPVQRSYVWRMERVCWLSCEIAGISPPGMKVCCWNECMRPISQRDFGRNWLE